MFGHETNYTTVTNSIVVMHVPSTDAKLCTEYIDYFMMWLDSEYLADLPSIADFEESILKDYQ